MLLKGRFIAGVAGLALMSAFAGAGVAQAQTDTSAPPANPAPKKPASDATAVGELVVTGTRIKHTNYNSPDPITQITSEQAQLTGAIDTSQILQLSSVANNNVQINNNFTGFVVTGGPGVNTLSLRGLGAQRTLILIDGQRMGPAGVGGTVGPVDLNTIPASIIDHVDIDNTGASSIYGSDAVAGVVNIITKKNLNGGTLQVNLNPTQQPGGGEYDVNGSWGKTFDRGFITAGFDAYSQEAVKLGERGYFSCARDLASFPGGATADIIDPATNQPKCNNVFLTPGIEDAALGILYRPAPNGPTGFDYMIPGGGPPGFGSSTLDQPGFQAVGLNNQTLTELGLPGSLTVAQTRASAGLIPYNPSQYGQADAVSPVRRYTITLNGGFDLTPHAQLYGSFIFNERDSSQTSISQFFGVANPANPQNPGFYLPLPVLPQLTTESEKVDYYRFVAGIKGDVPSFGPINNWTYDVYGQASLDRGSYKEEYEKADRVNAVLDAGNAEGCDTSFLAANDQVACVPFNLYQDVTNGGFNAQQRAFLYSTETGHTNYDQYYIDGSTTGDLFKLPAGTVKVAVGTQFRWESLDDVPPPDFVAQNAYNLSTTGVTKGSEHSEEVYGEVEVPIFRDDPFIKRFDLTLSGRYSNYSTYGSNGTYKIGLDWQINDWLTFRATEGTAFRAPALYEQFLADQTSFLGQISIDPCILYGSNSGLPANIKNSCAALGLPGNYPGTQTSATITQGGGSSLKPETSINNTIGLVFQPKWFGLNLKVAATYYTYDIKNQITNFGAANIIFQCYDSPTPATSPYCKLFDRQAYDPAQPLGTTGGINSVEDNFINVAEQIDQGLDVEITYVTQLPKDFKLTVESNLAWTFYTRETLLGGQANNFLGQVGQPAFNGNINFRLDRGPWTINYYLYAVGTSSDNDFVSNTDTNYNGTGQTVLLNHTVPFYTDSDISVRRKFDKFSLTLGIKNLYDTPPPYYSSEGFQSRTGVVPLSSQYDFIGRSFFLTIDKKF